MCTGIPFVPSLSPCSGLRLTDGWIAAGVAAFCLVVSIALVFVCYCYVGRTSHGDMLSRFLQAYGSAIGVSGVARPGGEKYRSKARMIFLQTAKPERAALHARPQSRTFAVKNRRNISFLYEKCRPPPACISFLRAFFIASSALPVLPENVFSHFRREFCGHPQELLLA